MLSLIITFGWCGFGARSDLFPELRCGFVSFGWCRGAIRERLNRYRVELTGARDALERLLVTPRDKLGRFVRREDGSAIPAGNDCDVDTLR